MTSRTAIVAASVIGVTAACSLTTSFSGLSTGDPRSGLIPERTSARRCIPQARSRGSNDTATAFADGALQEQRQRDRRRLTVNTGTFSHVVLYDKALSQAQVRAHYQAGITK